MIDPLTQAADLRPQIDLAEMYYQLYHNPKLQVHKDSPCLDHGTAMRVARDDIAGPCHCERSV